MRARRVEPSRRTFVSSAAALSAYFWIPKPVKGYTTAELRAMAVGGTVKPGISKWDLDTPALCVDLDKMEKNIATMQASLKKFGLPSRPHAKTHKCAAIAKYQIATGSIGICCAKLGEAEAMVANGVGPILMTTANPSVSKIRRAMQIRKSHRDFIQAVDEEQNARDLSAAAKEAGVVADVVIDVAVGTRSGIPAGAGALALAQLVDTLPQPQAARHALVRRRRAAREGIREPQGARLEDDRPERRDVRDDEEGRPEHRDFQRRRHRHLQHHASRARIHRRAGGQLPVHGHAVPGDRERERRSRVHRLRALADRAHDGDEQQVSRPVDHRRRRRRRSPSTRRMPA